MAVRTLSAAAVLAAAAVVVYAVVRRERRLCLELERARAAAVSERLMAGTVQLDFAAFRRRIDGAVAERLVVAEADQVLSQALALHSIDPQVEGGPEGWGS